MPKPIRLTYFLICALACSLLATHARAQINVDNVLFMGRSALSADDNITAIHYFNQAIQARPQNAQAYYFRSYAKFVLEDFHGAETDCTHAVELNPYVIDFYLLRGLCRINLGDFDGALKDYTRALDDTPDDIGARFNQGYCYLQLKQTAQADSAMNRVLGRSPRYYRAFMMKTQIALEEKDTLRGLHWIDSLLTFRPREVAAWQFKGQYALDKEEYEQADSFLTKSIKYDTENFEGYLLRAMARNGMNRFDDAIGDYTRVIELVPQHFVAHYNRALLRALVGDDNRALADFSYVLQREPDNTLARYNRALLRERTGDFQGAITDYTELIKAYPDFTYGYYARAACRRKVGDIRGALADETVVARTQLDIAFSKPRKKSFKEVRRRSDLALEHYDRLIEEDKDTARIFGDIVIGKVQNTKAVQEFLPLFQLALHTESAYGYHALGFIDDLDILQKAFTPIELKAEREETGDRILKKCSRKIFFTAELSQEDIDNVSRHNDRILPDVSNLPLRQRFLLLSMLYRQVYALSDALEYAHQAVQADSTSVLTYLNRAGIMMALARNNRSEIFSDAPQETSLKSSPNYRQAIEEDYFAALHLAPTNAYIYYNRGCYYAMLEQWDAAMSDFNRAIELDARLAEAYYNRGIIYLTTGQKDLAIPDLSKAGELGLYKAYNLLKQTRSNK
ncbi:MAG: tetratricopeptide repeat protein [Alloprevotella sp.]|nr:tetratricopeptide repeat protein [Alloprevotella sp.]